MKKKIDPSKCCEIGSIKHICNFCFTMFAYPLNDNALRSITDIVRNGKFQRRYIYINADLARIGRCNGPLFKKKIIVSFLHDLFD